MSRAVAVPMFAGTGKRLAGRFTSCQQTGVPSVLIAHADWLAVETALTVPRLFGGASALVPQHLTPLAELTAQVMRSAAETDRGAAFAGEANAMVAVTAAMTIAILPPKLLLIMRLLSVGPARPPNEWRTPVGRKLRPGPAQRPLGTTLNLAGLVQGRTVTRSGFDRAVAPTRFAAARTVTVPGCFGRGSVRTARWFARSCSRVGGSARGLPPRGV